MSQIVERALRHWKMEGAEYELIAARENMVFRVDHTHGSTALRVHRRGYRTDGELRAELLWMQAISDGGIQVPAPIPTTSGDVLVHVDGEQIDMLTWLSGTTLDAAMKDRGAKERSVLFHALGRDMARLHDISDGWSRPVGFERVAWDANGMFGDTPLWGPFWNNPRLTSEDRNLFERFRAIAAADLTRFHGALDYGLIHADLVPANVMVEGDTLKLIDFDDGGFGFRIFDIATALLKYAHEDDAYVLRAALIRGYASIRKIDLTFLDLFLAIRAATYVGWNITRLEELGGVERNARFINTARILARDYLDKT